MESPSLSASPPTSHSLEHASLQPLSLYQVFRLYPRERLLVHPLQWTSRHLELLQCSFDQPLPATGKRKRDEYKPPYSDARAATRVRRFVSAHGGAREYWIDKLLADPKGPLVSIKGGFPFYYRQRPIGRMRCLSFSLRTQSDGCGLPVATWTDYPNIDDLRWDSVGVDRTGPRPNRPVRRLAMLRYKAVTPADPWRDPYILALLISIAQGQRIVLGQKEGQSDRLSFRSHVIFTDWKDKDQVHLFTADFPSVFLDRLDDPQHVPPSPISVSIRHTTVPFEPYKTLYTRLIELILPDSHSGVKEKCMDEIDVSDVENIALGKQQEGIDQVVQEMQGEVSTKQCRDDS